MSNIPTGYVPRTEKVHPGPIEMVDTDTTCNQALNAQGKPYPRTCKKCGIGPCIGLPIRTATEQPDPVPNDKPAVWPLVMVDMASRDNLGRKRYGTALQPFNGRDNLRDAYEEALDLAVYLRAAIYERDGK